jgi:hypothetical protein
MKNVTTHLYSHVINYSFYINIDTLDGFETLYLQLRWMFTFIKIISLDENPYLEGTPNRPIYNKYENFISERRLLR